MFIYTQLKIKSKNTEKSVKMEQKYLVSEDLGESYPSSFRHVVSTTGHIYHMYTYNTVYVTEKRALSCH